MPAADEGMIKLMVFLTQLEKGQFDLLGHYLTEHTLAEFGADIKVAKETKAGALGLLKMDDVEYNVLCSYIQHHDLEDLTGNMQIAAETRLLLQM
jgi:hypothetical protein